MQPSGLCSRAIRLCARAAWRWRSAAARPTGSFKTLPATPRGYPNSRVQSNISDQGSGYSPAPYGPYGQYYSRPVPRQSKAPQRQTFGFPSPGVSLPAGESWEAWYRARRPIADWGVAWSEENGRLVATQVTEESELARAGLHAGNQLVTVGGRPITTLAECARDDGRPADGAGSINRRAARRRARDLASDGWRSHRGAALAGRNGTGPIHHRRAFWEAARMGTRDWALCSRTALATGRLCAKSPKEARPIRPACCRETRFCR